MRPGLLPGVVEILSYENVPRILHTSAGQGLSGAFSLRRGALRRRMRFVGDRVALVVAESLEAAREAVQKIQVEYRMLEPLFDPEEALEPGAPRLHGGEDHAKIPVAYEPEENLAARRSKSPSAIWRRASPKPSSSRSSTTASRRPPTAPWNPTPPWPTSTSGAGW